MCYEMGECTVEYLKTVDKETLNDCVELIQDLYHNFDQLTANEKGVIIGQTIGKYGIAIFEGKVAFKMIQAYRNLKIANQLCNLEALTTSSAGKQKITTAAIKHASDREAYFKNIKLHLDRQNKHVPGKHNYEPDRFRSILTDPDPSNLLKEFAGKGVPKNKFAPGTNGYVERVDFGKVIGYYIDENTPTIKLPTTKGTVRYSKDGAHIVPSHPNG